jgi:uncharacterized protein YdiU (UPF0061 family)
MVLKDYSKWHVSKVDDNDLKNDYQKACQVVLKNGLDLQQIFNCLDSNFFIEKEVKVGMAHCFVDVNNIIEWVKHYQEQLDLSEFD